MDKHHHEKLIKIIGAILGLVVVVGVFALGYVLGGNIGEYICIEHFEKEGSFENIEDENPTGLLREHIQNRFAARGPIEQITETVVTVREPNGKNRKVSITEETKVRELRKALTISELKKGDFVTILGRPDGKGGLEAIMIQLEKRPKFF